MRETGAPASIWMDSIKSLAFCSYEKAMAEQGTVGALQFERSYSRPFNHLDRRFELLFSVIYLACYRKWRRSQLCSNFDDLAYHASSNMEQFCR